MNAEELRTIINFLKKKVTLNTDNSEESIVIDFDTPSAKDIIEAGLNAEGVKQILSAPWWEDMVIDIVETPELCDDDDSPQQVLEFSKDVVSEYIRKRFKLDDD